MIKIIRNDDCCADTTLHEIRAFCELCDRYGVTPLHAITPIGSVRSIDCRWDNARIRREAGTALFSENREVVEYLKGRDRDLLAVHGLWHTHEPELAEVAAADILIWDCFERLPTYFVPPFNEGEYGIKIWGSGDNLLTVSGRECPRLEEYLEAGDPQSEMAYLHTNRFWPSGPFTFEALDRCLKRLTQR